MKQKPSIHNLKYLKKYRKTLRKNLTPAEAYLWNQLKSRKFKGLKFRRQHSVGNYILDFYCSQYNLAIELDGDYHDNPKQKELDGVRDLFLKDKDIYVLRYENRYVFEELEHVLKGIENYCFGSRD
ncbi:endonuclease domain-containing protein [Nonlabens sp.]|uniref:endonuclease domain-containing protein n=1 Tax=Nonlabens sp. TaxID=1888209 RepID=UPI003F69ED87